MPLIKCISGHEYAREIRDNYFQICFSFFLCWLNIIWPAGLIGKKEKLILVSPLFHAGFYTAMLVPAALMGLICVIYGAVKVGSYIPV